MLHFCITLQGSHYQGNPIESALKIEQLVEGAALGRAATHSGELRDGLLKDLF